MNAQFSNHNNTTHSVPLDDVFVSTPVSATKLMSIIAAIVFTSASLLAVTSGKSHALPSEINGVKVINLAPVEVRPSAADLRAAALLADDGIAATATTLSRQAEVDAGLLGAQLAMPYYSFGNKFGRISTKE